MAHEHGHADTGRLHVEAGESKEAFLERARAAVIALAEGGGAAP